MMRNLRRIVLLVTVVLFSLLFPLVQTSQPTFAQDAPPTFHNSRDLTYRSPFGAVTTGSEITLRLRTPANSPESVLLRVYDLNAQQETFHEMTKVLTTPENHDYWEYKLKTPDAPTVLQYRFIIRRGDTLLYYEDDTKDEKGFYNIAKKGGAGIPLPDSRNQNWQITVYTPDFATPQWVHNATIYQIFPDRFRNGDKSNDPKSGSDTFYGSLPLKFHATWNEKMEDAFKFDPTAPPNSDFYGGDLKGIQDKLPYLKELGITAIYLNPIFQARSNHRYDTADYKTIDPFLGTQADWDALVKAANEQDIRIILDGVFNHASSDGPLFDRYHRFSGEGGACESVESPYREWFFFRKPQANDPQNACVDNGTGETAYESWFGFDSIPKLNSANPEVRSFIYGSKDSVARHWITEGASGWRLDVAGDIDDGSAENTYWEEFREAVKTAHPDAVIISEIWDDVSRWVTGTQFDSTMNYRMRTAIMSFVIKEPFADNDVSWLPANPVDFDGMVMAQIEDYPPQAMYAMMNLLDSHDTSRLAFMVGNDSQSQKLAAFLQFMMPGAPTIYYSDEIALKAPSVEKQDDPYNRAPYPWEDEQGSFYPAPDKDMLAFYQKLGHMRMATPVLRTGAYRTLLTDQNGVYAVMRHSPEADTPDAAFVIANRANEDLPFEIEVPVCVTNGTLKDVLGNDQATVENGKLRGVAKARSGAVYIGTCTTFTVADPAELTATAGDAQVELTLPTGVQYDVYRSYFPDTGFTRINETPQEKMFTDTTVKNSYRYYYYIQARPTASNGGATSEVVMAAPGGKIDSVTLVENKDAAVMTVVSAKGFDVFATPTISSEAPQRLLAEVALVAPGTQPDAVEQWQPLKAGKNNRYTATLRPTRAGDYTAVARFSADAGETWVYSNELPVKVGAPASTTPPDMPANVAVSEAKPFKVILSWGEVPSAYAYRIYKGTERQLIGEVTSTTFIDRNVIEGQEYVYTVTTIDENLNESEAPTAVTASIKAGGSEVTFSVKVPENTPADDVIFIAGDFGVQDIPQWNPGAEKMQLTRNDDGTWSITLKLPTGASPQYKYTRGSWERVEKGSQCEEIANRTILVKSGSSVVNDEVLKWRDVDKCP